MTKNIIMDVHSKDIRRKNMQSIRSKDTKIELIVRRYLHSNGLRYRLHSPSLPGKPDIVIPKYQTIVLVNGCFFHRHENCMKATIPDQNREKWLKKFSENIARDKVKIKELEDLCWNVIVVWGCELEPKKQENTLQGLLISIIRNTN